MIVFKEANPLPLPCQECGKEYGEITPCDNCEHMLDRFEMLEVDDDFVFSEEAQGYIIP